MVKAQSHWNSFPIREWPWTLCKRCGHSNNFTVILRTALSDFDGLGRGLRSRTHSLVIFWLWHYTCIFIKCPSICFYCNAVNILGVLYKSLKVALSTLYIHHYNIVNHKSQVFKFFFKHVCQTLTRLQTPYYAPFFNQYTV